MKFLRKFLESKTGLLTYGLISVLGGLGMIIRPEKTSVYIIMGIGCIWFFEGLTSLLKFIYKVKNK